MNICDFKWVNVWKACFKLYMVILVYNSIPLILSVFFGY